MTNTNNGNIPKRAKSSPKDESSRPQNSTGLAVTRPSAPTGTSKKASGSPTPTSLRPPEANQAGSQLARSARQFPHLDRILDITDVGKLNLRNLDFNDSNCWRISMALYMHFLNTEDLHTYYEIPFPKGKDHRSGLGTRNAFTEGIWAKDNMVLWVTRIEDVTPRGIAIAEFKGDIGPGPFVLSYKKKGSKAWHAINATAQLDKRGRRAFLDFQLSTIGSPAGHWYHNCEIARVYQLNRKDGSFGSFRNYTSGSLNPGGVELYKRAERFRQDERFPDHPVGAYYAEPSEDPRFGKEAWLNLLSVAGFQDWESPPQPGADNYEDWRDRCKKARVGYRLAAGPNAWNPYRRNYNTVVIACAVYVCARTPQVLANRIGYTLVGALKYGKVEEEHLHKFVGKMQEFGVALKICAFQTDDVQNAHAKFRAALSEGLVLTGGSFVVAAIRKERDGDQVKRYADAFNVSQAAEDGSRKFLRFDLSEDGTECSNWYREAYKIETYQLKRRQTPAIKLELKRAYGKARARDSERYEKHKVSSEFCPTSFSLCPQS